VESLKSIEIDDVEIKININLERYTTIKLAGNGHIAICSTEDGLKSLISKISQLDIDFHLIGWGANQVLVRTKKTLFVKIEFPFDKKIIEKDVSLGEFSLPASAPLNQLTSMAIKLGLKGWEVFTGIPATLGGAICMNAGTSLGAIGELIKSVRILDVDGNIKDYECNENSFLYRNNQFLNKGDVILSAVIKHNGIDDSIGSTISKYLEKRKKTQPLMTKNCGSVFKNLDVFTAGKVIDCVGLKAFGFENLSVSQIHGNFIENSGGATAVEFEQLVLLLKDEIERYSGLKFELEVKVY